MLKNRKVLLTTGKNAIWLLIDTFVKKLASLMVAVVVVRYLSTDQWGIYSYSFLFVSFIAVIGSFGIDQIIVRDLVKGEQSEDVVLTNSFILKTLGSIATSLLSVVLIVSIYGWSMQSFAVLIVAIGYIFNSFIVFDLWFQSKVLSRYPVIIRSVLAVVFAILKVSAVYAHASIYVFCALGVAELALGWIITFPIFLHFRKKMIKVEFSATYFKSLIFIGIPLIVSGVVGMVGARADQFILGTFLDKSSLALYANAVMVAEIGMFIASSITSSVAPSLYEARRDSEELFHQRRQVVASIMLWTGIFSSLGIALVGKILIPLVFGEKYLFSTNILFVYIWSNVPIFWGSYWNTLMVAENSQHKILLVNAYVAVSNVVANLIIIRTFGVLGVAWVNVLSYGSSILVMTLLSTKYHMGDLFFNALLGKGIITSYKGKPSLLSTFFSRKELPL